MPAAKWYKIVTELRYPADAASLKKALSGTWEGKLNWKTVYPGDLVNDLPTEIVGTLLETKDIEPAKAPTPSKTSSEEKEG